MGRIYRYHHAATILTEQLRHRQLVKEKAQRDVKTLAAELISRIGVDEYECWIDNEISDDDQPNDIRLKMRTKLEAIKEDAFRAHLNAWDEWSKAINRQKHGVVSNLAELKAKKDQCEKHLEALKDKR